MTQVFNLLLTCSLISFNTFGWTDIFSSFIILWGYRKHLSCVSNKRQKEYFLWHISSHPHACISLFNNRCRTCNFMIDTSYFYHKFQAVPLISTSKKKNNQMFLFMACYSQLEFLSYSCSQVLNHGPFKGNTLSHPPWRNKLKPFPYHHHNSGKLFNSCYIMGAYSWYLADIAWKDSVSTAPVAKEYSQDGLNIWKKVWSAPKQSKHYQAEGHKKDCKKGWRKCFRRSLATVSVNKEEVLVRYSWKTVIKCILHDENVRTGKKLS